MQSNESDPLGIFLVSSGTRGDRLLFRYPYDPPSSEDHVAEPENPYTVKVLTKSDDFDVNRIAVKELNSDPVSGPLSGYPDVVLSHILCTRSNITRRRFQLKVNDIVFIGYPLQLMSPGGCHANHSCNSAAGQQSTSVHPSPKREQQTSSGSFNVVFAIKAGASDYVLSAYQELAKQLSVALLHDERRCGYFTKQKQMMWDIQDENNISPEENNIAVEAFQIIAHKCSLAKQLTHIYSSLCEIGVVQLYVNKWVPVSFCLVPKYHSSVVLGTGRQAPIKYETVRSCVEAIRPYHTVLLLEDEQLLLSSLPIDSSPSLIRFINVVNPLKNIYSLAIDVDLAVEQVLQVVSHLVYWAKAVVIYPICDSNIYLLSPHCNMSPKSSLSEEFSRKFPGLILAKILSQFSVRVSLRDHLNTLAHRHCQSITIPVLIWLLRHHFLYQVHTYVTLLPPGGDHVSQTVSPGIDGVHHMTDSVTSPTDNVTITTHSTLHSSFSGSLPGAVPGELPGVLIGSLSGSLPDVLSGTSRSVFDGKDELCSELTDSVVEWRRQGASQLIGNLNHRQLEAIYTQPAASNSDDLKLFIRLCTYFDGSHHIEEIAFYENMKRSQVVTLLEKFHKTVVLCHHEEPAISYWIHC